MIPLCSNKGAKLLLPAQYHPDLLQPCILMSSHDASPALLERIQPHQAIFFVLIDNGRTVLVYSVLMRSLALMYCSTRVCA